MRVLVVTAWFPSPAAPEVGIFNLRDVELLALDHEVTVVHLAAPSVFPEAVTERIGELTVHRIPTSVTSARSIRRASRDIARLAEKADLLHSMAISALLPLRRRIVRVPWVHTEHWSGFLAPQTVPAGIRLTGFLLARRLRRPDVVVTVSEALANAVRRYRRDGQTMVIANDVMTPPAGALIAREVADPLRLVAVGALIPRKGPLLAVCTVERLRARGQSVTLRWIGEGDLRPAVREAAARLGVADVVELLGRVPPEGVSRVLLDSDVFLLPTEGETFGVSIAEALTHGLSVVVGSHGGQREFIGPQDGILVADQGPDAYADAVTAVVSDRTASTPVEIAARAARRFAPESRRVAYRAAYDLAIHPEGSGS